jgi:hypothetical protein
VRPAHEPDARQRHLRRRRSSRPAQVRVDLARTYLREAGIEAIGEVGDPDPYTAAMDAILEFQPDEIVVSTLPATSSGWLRRDLVERITDASGLPMEHVVVDMAAEGLPFKVTLVVANRTASSDTLLEHLRKRTESDEGGACTSSSSPSRAAAAPRPRRRGPARPSSWTGCARRGCSPRASPGDPTPTPRR